jgi:hypothetical protein
MDNERNAILPLRAQYSRSSARTAPVEWGGIIEMGSDSHKRCCELKLQRASNLRSKNYARQSGRFEINAKTAKDYSGRKEFNLCIFSLRTLRALRLCVEN